MYDRKDRWTVGQWMTANPQTIAPETSVRAAFFKMRSEGFRHLLVVDDGELVGIVTDRDLRRPDLTADPDGWHDLYRLDDDYEVRHVMTSKPMAAATHDKLEKALDRMIDYKVGALPVVDKGERLIGVLTEHDVHRAFRQLLREVEVHEDEALATGAG